MFYNFNSFLLYLKIANRPNELKQHQVNSERESGNHQDRGSKNFKRKQDLEKFKRKRRNKI